MTTPHRFLNDFDLLPLASSDIPSQLTPVGLALGNGTPALEVAFVTCQNQPSQSTMRQTWRSRVAGRATPVLLVAAHGARATICGPVGDNPATLMDLDVGQAERLCRAALKEPDRHAAIRRLRSAFDQIDAGFPGIRNMGLLSTHELKTGLTGRPDYSQATAQGQRALTQRGRELLRTLGFSVQDLAGPASLLLAGPHRLAVGVLLERNEAPEVSNQRFSGLSPVSYALAKAEEQALPYILTVAGGTLRLYPTSPEVGVGRRGLTETYVEGQLELLPGDQAALLWYLFSAEALAPQGLLSELLQASRRFAADLGGRLRERVYRSVVPNLATALARARNLESPGQEQLDETYQMALLVLFRLLFIAYAEDRDLLPYHSNEHYKTRSLKQKALELKDLADNAIPFDHRSESYWDEARLLFQSLDKGGMEWGVPAYNGGLFSSDPAVAPVGVLLTQVSLTNDVFGLVLKDLLLEETSEGLGPVDFRSLGVRSFGTIYEGLLESELAVAETDLDVDERGSYVPTSAPDPKVREGEIYLHDRSGARKETGSYFTKDFAVEHLLKHSLEPALEDHIATLNNLPIEEAERVFFDFRVVDIAMGSGHFLVAALDHIEARLSNYLAERTLPRVTEELSRLKESAMSALGSLAGQAEEIEDTQLLRRQIARRCIYGVDRNPMAVELARLSLWVHTFIPGLPLSLLDPHLVQGDSLVGIATLEEAGNLMEAQIAPDQLARETPVGGEVIGRSSLFNTVIAGLVEEATDVVGLVGRSADADMAEVSRAREARENSQQVLRPLAAIFDILAASRLDESLRQEIEQGQVSSWVNDIEMLPGSGQHRKAREVMKDIPPFHFPVAFPEIFQRERPGFDVILGNPPWEKARVEEHGFWARHSPGFKGLSQRERESEAVKLRGQRPDLVAVLEKEVAEATLLRRVLVAGPYPGMGAGDPDLYKAFCWRFWHLAARPGGRIGVVLPRSVWATKGSEPFRKTVFQEGKLHDLTFLLNSLKWVFDDLHPQYTVSLSNLEKTPPSVDAALSLRGPFRSPERFYEGIAREPSRFPVKEVLGWTDTAALPLLPSEDSPEVFAQLRRAPRLDLNEDKAWRVRPSTELHATNDKDLMTFGESPPRGYWPVFKGESFDLWEPDRGLGSYYAWIDSALAQRHIQDKRVRSRRGRNSPFSEFPQSWANNEDTLPCRYPRIAFRDVSRATDTRTVRAALIPPRVVVQHKAPYFLMPKGDEKDEAFLLGVLSSIPLDWYARRFVETSLTYHVLNPFPIPRAPRSSNLWQRAVALAGRLACPDERFADWARAVGVEHGPLDPSQKQDMIDELDAVVAHLYALSESQLCHIFETFHEGWDYVSRLEATLKHYRAWQAG